MEQLNKKGYLSDSINVSDFPLLKNAKFDGDIYVGIIKMLHIRMNVLNILIL